MKLCPTGVSQKHTALETQCGGANELPMSFVPGDAAAVRDPTGLEEFALRKWHWCRPAMLCK
tara:strand:- start:302 stop:487 length:186 start_codon:yes stop_codon:yes gene_type:complete